MAQARYINIFLRDGDPEGIRTAQIMLSTIQMIAFRKMRFKDVKELYPELASAGVYLLIGHNPDQSDSMMAYIGESECVADRLQTHINENKKTHWLDTLVAVSKDESLTKSHARYVEARLLADASQNPRWTLVNGQKAKEKGKIPEPDQVVMDEFIAQTKTLVGALGFDIFKVVSGNLVATPNGGPQSDLLEGATFSFSGNGFEATMLVTQDGEYVVQKGSKAKITVASSAGKGSLALRQSLSEKRILTQKGDYLEFSKDVLFNSTSAAAEVVAGYSVAGPTAWKSSRGQTYRDWEKEQLAEPGQQSAGGSW